MGKLSYDARSHEMGYDQYLGILAEELVEVW